MSVNILNVLLYSQLLINPKGTDTATPTSIGAPHSRMPSDSTDGPIDYAQFMQTLAEITQALEAPRNHRPPAKSSLLPRSNTHRDRSTSSHINKDTNMTNSNVSSRHHLLAASQTSRVSRSRHEKILYEPMPFRARAVARQRAKDTKPVIKDPMCESMDDLLDGNMTFNHCLESKIEAQIEKRACSRLRNSKLTEINSQKYYLAINDI
ncbi:hypothetical protein CLU79DRAFT_832629 [Phycomyces nitens]|nr:hypothetical protein CLU79DRAFT_832629 [Phycomyces nitens]